MLGACEHTEEAPHDRLETALCILRRNFRNRRLRPDDELQLRDEVREEAAVAADGFVDRGSPTGDLVLGLAQDLTDDGLERLRERCIRDVALVLIELAGGEEPPR